MVQRSAHVQRSSFRRMDSLYFIISRLLLLHPYEWIIFLFYTNYIYTMSSFIIVVYAVTFIIYIYTEEESQQIDAPSSHHARSFIRLLTVRIRL